MSEILCLDYDNEKQFSVALASYPDGMPLAQCCPKGVSSMLLRPRSLASFMAALFWVDALVDRGNPVPGLILPFVPGARQDRLNDSGDCLFTVKSVAKEINARNFPRVTIVDPHSEVAPALIERCSVIHAADCIVVPPGKYAAVISPDAGAEKRAGAVARKLGVPLIHAWKARNVSSGAIDGFGYDSVAVSCLSDDGRSRMRRLLIVDDICDGGGTFVGLAEAIKRGSENVDLHLWTTHGIFSKGVDPLRAHYSHIYCTDSILADRPGVIEIPVCKNLFEKGAP